MVEYFLFFVWFFFFKQKTAYEITVRDWSSDVCSSDLRLVEVWNKLDRLDADGRARLQNLAERKPPRQRPVPVSALTGEGIDGLTRTIEGRLGLRRTVLDLLLDPADGAGVSWLHRHAEVMTKSLDDQGRLAMTVRVDSGKADAVRAKFPSGAFGGRRP